MQEPSWVILIIGRMQEQGLLWMEASPKAPLNAGCGSHVTLHNSVQSRQIAYKAELLAEHFDSNLEIES